MPAARLLAPAAIATVTVRVSPAVASVKLVGAAEPSIEIHDASAETFTVTGADLLLVTV